MTRHKRQDKRHQDKKKRHRQASNNEKKQKKRKQNPFFLDKYDKIDFYIRVDFHDENVGILRVTGPVFNINLLSNGFDSICAPP